MDWSKLPGPLMQALLPFQKEGVRFAVEKNGRCLIADEMGLGKTLQAISAACMYRDEWPLLVIVPSCVKFCWIEEFEKWLPDILPHDINLIQSGADASGIANSPISIVTYGLLRIPSAKLVQETIRRRKFQVVICDESHYLKNTKTLSSKIIVPIIKMAKRRILLSGTPALARPVELYPQLDAVCPGKWDTFWQFTERYCEPRYLHYRGRRQRKADGASNLEELQQRMSGMLMIRREKSQVLTELPPKQRQRVLFELKDSSLKKEITNRFDSLRQNIHKGSRTFQQLAASMRPVADQQQDGQGNELAQSTAQEDDNGLAVFTDVSTLYRISGEAKIGPVREYIEMLCENEDLKFLVFAYHHNMMNGVELSLHAKRVRFVRIDGNTKPVDRQAYVSQFQSDPSTRVAILSILAAGVGLTLTSAKLVVFAELYWTPGVMVQCEDRAHRIGQTDRLSVHYLVAKNTMDEWVWSSVCKKTVVTSTALTGKSCQLEHEEGDQHQIDVLSKADAWIPQEPDEADMEDVGQLIKSQRQPDQPSILDFLSSPRQQNNTPNGNRIGSNISKQERLRFASPMTKIKAAHKNLDNSLIVVVDSDEEAEEFKPVRKKRRKVKSSVVEMETVSTEEELGRKSEENCENCINLHSGKIVGSSSHEEKDGRCSSSDDLFSDKSSDSDSDSLPDVYLGQMWEKRKRKTNCTDTTDSSTIISVPDVDRSSKSLNSDKQENGLCEDFDSKAKRLPGTKNRKRKLSVEGLSQTKCFADKRLSFCEQNLVSNLDGKQSSENKLKSSIASGTENSSGTNSDSDSMKNSQSSESAALKSVSGMLPNEDPVQDGTDIDVTNVESCNMDSSQSQRDLFDNQEYLCENNFYSAPKLPATTPHKGEKRLETEYPGQWPCSACTFLNHQELGQCEICDTPKKTKTRNNKKVRKKAASQVSVSQSSQLHSLNDSQSFVAKNSTGDDRNLSLNGTEKSDNFKSYSLSLDVPTSPTICNDKDALNLNAARVQNEGTSYFHDNDEMGELKDDDGVDSCDTANDAKFGTNKHKKCNNGVRNSYCVDYRDSHSEDGVENYEIENFYSDEDEAVGVRRKENNSVVKNDLKHEKILSDVDVDDDSIDTCGSEGNADMRIKGASDSEHLELSNGCDNDNHFSGNDNLENRNSVCVVEKHVEFDDKEECAKDMNKNIEDLNAVGDSTYDRTDNSLVDRDNTVINGCDSFPCDELSNEDFDKIEDFLSRNGHIDVTTDNKLSHLSNSNHTQSSVITVGLTLSSSSTSRSSNLIQKNCVTATLSSSSLPSSSPQPPTPPTTTATVTATTTPVLADSSPLPNIQLCHRIFQFSCSLHTGRIYLYDEKGQSLNVNFHPIDIEMGNTDRLPDFLKQPSHYRLLNRFVREWMSLSATKRRVIAKRGLVFERPIQAYETVRSVHGSTQRHLAKDSLNAASEKAESIQGQVRLIQRPNPDGVPNGTATNGDAGSLKGGQGTVQVVTSDGVPLCLQCHKPYTNPLLPSHIIARPENAWQLRLCSRACMDKYWTLKHASYLRDQIFEVEKGICRLCHFDAQAFYNRMKCTKDVRQRAEIVNQSPYQKLGPKARERLVTQVMQGQFWHVDHIVPVWRGGGMCDLDNLRTLCTPCHTKVTKDQAGQRANIRKLSSAVSSGDITAFFKKS